MYKVKMDGRTLYYPGDKEATLINPVIKLMTGYAGSFEFTIPPKNPEYIRVRNRQSMVTVYRDGKEIFYGEVRKQPKKDRYNNLQVYCAGAMSFLADSIQPQMEYHDMSPRAMLSVFLDNHNGQVEEKKKIYIGMVTVTDSNNSLYRYTNREDTLTAIRKKLVEKVGGVLRLRHENDKLYLDWITLEEYGKYCEQPIEFGMNMMDYSESRSGENIATALIPLGARLEGESDIEALEKYVDITSVNGGRDYLYNAKAVETFGWIWKTVTWQDVNEPSNLKRKGEQWLKENQFEELTLQLTAIDLSLMDKEYDTFEIGDRIPCRAKVYGMNKVFPVMEMTIPLMKPEAATLTLGENRKVGYTEQQSGILSGMQSEAEERRKIANKEIQQAINDLTNKMTGATGGYKLTEYDESGKWLRDLYMDAPDKNQATKVLQINKNGIGGSKNGYGGPYTVGMTLDGQIIGERILANSITSEKLSTEYKEELEKKFTYVKEKANEYTDKREETVRETITTSMKSLEKQIQLSVLDQKSIASSYDYVKGGDNQDLTLGNFTAAPNMSVITTTEKNIKCFKITKSDTNSTKISQSLGKLPKGEYEVQIKIYVKPGEKPNYIYFGMNGYTSYQSMNAIETEKWITVSRTVNITSESTREFQCTIYGAYAATLYITDVRVLRNVKELIDDVDARVSVEVGKISQKVSEVYEAQQHDYIECGNFANSPSNYWYASDGTNVVFTNHQNKNCVKISASDSTSYYVRTKNSIRVPKAGKFKVRFKACSDQTNTRARFSFYYGAYTATGEITKDWKEFEMEFPGEIPVGSRYLYIYNYVQGTTLYITDVELLGYASHYNAAQIDIVKDEITHTVQKDEFASYLKQYYNSVIVAFNNSSKYVQINAGEIAIYDYGVSQSKKRAVFDENGNHFWRNGYEIGKIGTNVYTGNNSLRGLVFDLEYDGAYMTWAAETTSSAKYYTMMWTYCNRSVGDYSAGKLHAGCDIDMHGWTLRNPSFEGGGITGTLNCVQILNMNSDGTVNRWSNNCQLQFKNGILIYGRWYS